MRIADTARAVGSFLLEILYKDLRITAALWAVITVLAGFHLAWWLAAIVSVAVLALLVAGFVITILSPVADVIWGPHRRRHR